MTSSGVYQMFKRRADQAGYDIGEIHPHMMRDILSALFPCRDSRRGELPLVAEPRETDHRARASCSLRSSSAQAHGA
jgi:hypothetical protein